MRVLLFQYLTDRLPVSKTLDTVQYSKEMTITNIAMAIIAHQICDDKPLGNYLVGFSFCSLVGAIVLLFMSRIYNDLNKY